MSVQITTNKNRQLRAWLDKDFVIVEERERYAPRKWTTVRISLERREIEALDRMAKESTTAA